MFRCDQGSDVLHQVGRTGRGQTAQIRMDWAFVQPPYLVRPFTTRAHVGAYARTRSRARVFLHLGQGREVRQIKDWSEFAPSDLPSDLSLPWTR